MSLTTTEIKNAKPREKPFRMFDEKGLYLEVAPSGGKWWRFKYRVAGKEKRLSLGTFLEVSLAEARESRDDARNGVRAAYNYAEFLPERRKMMQAWAAYLDALRESRKVVPLFQAIGGKQFGLPVLRRGLPPPASTGWWEAGIAAPVPPPECPWRGTQRMPPARLPQRTIITRHYVLLLS